MEGDRKNDAKPYTRGREVICAVPKIHVSPTQNDKEETQENER